MLKEIRAHEQRRHWELVHRSTVPEGAVILPSVWSMRRKRLIKTGEIYKWKARLNVGGHKQRKGIDYNLTYSPVIAWPVVRMWLTHFIMRKWVTRQLDFVLAYPHAFVERPTYIAMPQGFDYQGRRDTHVLRIVRNLYGGKNAGRTWFLFCRDYLVSLGFTQSQVDPCVFYYRTDALLLLFVDDVILGARTQEICNDVIHLLQDNVDVDDQGDLCDYLGVHVTPIPGGLKLSQPQLIDSILQDLGLTTASKPLLTPAVASRPIHADLEGQPHDESFNYRAVVGKLNYLEKSTRPDLAFAVHQCARFLSRPTTLHAKAVRRIGRYLLSTKDQGYNIIPDNAKGMECYVDASFAGEWAPDRRLQASTDPNTARSRTGFIIMFAGVPMLWASKMQTEIALSSTEAELIALSAATREVIFLMRLVADAGRHGHHLHVSTTDLHCRILEDNMGTIAIAQEPRIRPRTKHINQKYWHFVTYLKTGLMSIHWIASGDMLADALTKALPPETFRRLTSQIHRWPSDG